MADLLSPLWWTDRLFKRLAAQQEQVEFYDAYYSGNHPLPWLAPGAREEFRRILEMTRSNYMGLVVDAQVERCAVAGFRLGPAEEAADRDTWRIWQANDLDGTFDQALLEAAIGGRSYLLVAPNASDARTPHVWVEHASQAVVEYVPGTNRRVAAAGLKVWTDDWSGLLHATLYKPEGLYKWQAKATTTGAAPRWERRSVPNEAWPAPNPLGVVPLVEIQNNPRLLTGGVSELADVTDVQDRVNKTIADRIVTQDFGAFPQKWASGWPDEDANGNETAAPITTGRNRIVTTDVTEARFGQWDAAPLDPYSSAKREDVKDIASRTRTPAQYLLGEMSNVNGETLKASESGLVSKVRSRQRGYDTGLEPAVRLMRRAAGLGSDGDALLEVIWRDPQYRTEGESTDAAIKRYQSGITTQRQAREDVGYSQTQIDRMERQDAALEARVAVVANGLAGVSVTGDGAGS